MMSTDYSRIYFFGNMMIVIGLESGSGAASAKKFSTIIVSANGLG